MLVSYRCNNLGTTLGWWLAKGEQRWPDGTRGRTQKYARLCTETLRGKVERPSAASGSLY
jgi:hypothetical protein